MNPPPEDNIGQIAAQLFANEPPAPGTVELGLADCAPCNATTAEQAGILFEVLTLLMIEGIKVRYGPDKRPEHLTAAQVENIARYFLSCGFILYTRSEHLMTPPPVPEQLTELKHFCQRFYDTDRLVWHEIYFDFATIHHVDRIPGNRVEKSV